MKEEFDAIPIFREHDHKCRCSTGLVKSVLPIKIKLVHPDAKKPRYAKPGDAGMDVFAVSIDENDDYIEYDTGFALEIPQGYVGLLFPRSSNSKKDLLLANSCGIIDSGYRGTCRLRFKRVTNDRKKLHHTKYDVGDAVGQIMILPYPEVCFEEVDELASSERGENGFGSTGK